MMTLAQKTAFVLPDAPSLGFVFSGAPRDLQSSFRDAGRPVLGRVEHRKVLAHDLFARIALDPFRTGIPIDDVTLRIKHVDRVISDALHEQPEASFRLLELRQAHRKFPGAFRGSLFQISG